MSENISVITITLNECGRLKRTWQSLVNQTCSSFRWIVVDGASTDGTVDWLNSLQDLRVEWTSEQDGGIYNAMNKGLERISGFGSWCVFLNSGDSLADEAVLSDFLEALAACEERPRFVYGNAVEVFPDGQRFLRPAKDISWLGRGMISHHQAMLFYLEAGHEQRYREEYTLSSDYAFVYDFVSGLPASEILRLDRPICEFSMDGVSQRGRISALSEDLHIRRHLMGMPLPRASFLYLLHRVHHPLKNVFGTFFRRRGTRKLGGEGHD